VSSLQAPDLRYFQRTRQARSVCTAWRGHRQPHGSGSQLSRPRAAAAADSVTPAGWARPRRLCPALEAVSPRPQVGLARLRAQQPPASLPGGEAGPPRRPPPRPARGGQSPPGFADACGGLAGQSAHPPLTPRRDCGRAGAVRRRKVGLALRGPELSLRVTAGCRLGSGGRGGSSASQPLCNPAPRRGRPVPAGWRGRQGGQTWPGCGAGELSAPGGVRRGRAGTGSFLWALSFRPLGESCLLLLV